MRVVNQDSEAHLYKSGCFLGRPLQIRVTRSTAAEREKKTLSAFCHAIELNTDCGMREERSSRVVNASQYIHQIFGIC